MLTEVLDLYKKGHRIEQVNVSDSVKDGFIESLYRGEEFALEEHHLLDGIIDRKQDNIVCKGRLSAAVDRAASYLSIYEVLRHKEDKERKSLKDGIERVMGGGFSYDSDVLQCCAMLSDLNDEGQKEAVISAIMGDGGGKYHVFGSGLNKDELEQRNALEHRLQAMRSTTHFNKLLALLGDAISFVHALKKQKDKKGQGAITGLEFGNDIANIVPDEYIAFICPQLTNLFLLDYVNENLLQDKIESKETVGKGDVYIQLDISGSMAWGFSGSQAHDGMTRLNCAIALIFALMIELRKDKRHVILTAFNDHAYTVFDARTQDNLKCFESLLDLVKSGPKFGTKFSSGWNLYLRHCSHNVPIDVLWITDGEDMSFSFKYFKEEIDKLNVKVITMIISDSPANYNPQKFEIISDVVKVVSNFDELKDLVDLSI